jgi:SAM-dependent methyltransferase
MRQPPISQSEIEARIAPHLDELLALWWAEQGACKPRDLELIASVLPFPRDEALRALDLCCGPGDVGRAIHREYPKSQIDGVDRDPFLAAICRGLNRRDRIPGDTLVRDLQDDDWDADLQGNYDVVATVNALHWFDAGRAGALLVDVYQLLRSGGVFLFAEPVSAETPFAPGFAAWKSTQRQRYSQDAWEQFWSRANAILGYDHVALLGPRHSNCIGDGLCVAGWIALAAKAASG